MKKNMHNIDKVVRIIIAAVIGFWLYNGNLEGILGYLLLAIAVIFVLTSFVGFCPLYRALNITTLKKEG